jgi:hypothetical protein
MAAVPLPQRVEEDWEVPRLVSLTPILQESWNNMGGKNWWWVVERPRLPTRAGPGTKGGNFTDITAVRNGEVLHVNTVSTLADGVTPTAGEAAAAAAIRAKLGPGERLILVPKKP